VGLIARKVVFPQLESDRDGRRGVTKLAPRSNCARVSEICLGWVHRTKRDLLVEATCVVGTGDKNAAGCRPCPTRQNDPRNLSDENAPAGTRPASREPRCCGTASPCEAGLFRVAHCCCRGRKGKKALQRPWSAAEGLSEAEEPF
jgi:hypothetical protein